VSFMNDNNTRKLYKQFKFLNKKTLPDGFECEDGWYALVYNMCKELKECAPLDFVITRVMNKYGELEVHTKNGNMPTRIVLSAYRSDSMDICDRCGNDKELQSCDKCTVPEVDYSTDDDEEDDNGQETLCSGGGSCAPASGGT